jgi:hypothetical protein
MMPVRYRRCEGPGPFRARDLVAGLVAQEDATAADRDRGALLTGRWYCPRRRCIVRDLDIPGVVSRHHRPQCPMCRESLKLVAVVRDVLLIRCDKDEP